MTGAAAMTEFTPPAEARLTDYLAQVRQALYAHPDVSPDEVEADVREHIATEFARLTRPVTLSELETVLTRLGPPTQWAAAGANSVAGPRVEPFDWKAFVAGVRRRVLGVFATLWKGPEDWRLAYLTFFLTLLTPVTFGVSLVFAYFFGRAAVELAKEKGEPLGARRWLTYPAILAVCMPLFLAVAFWPIPATGIEMGEQIRHARHSEAENWKVRVTRMEKQPGPAPGTTKWVTVQSLEPIAAEQRAEYEGTLNLVRKMPVSIGSQDTTLQLFCIVGAVAAWWTILGLIYWAFPKWPTTLFHPLLDGYDYLHGVRLAACAGLALVIWAGFAYRLWEAARIGGTRPPFVRENSGHPPGTTVSPAVFSGEVCSWGGRPMRNWIVLVGVGLAAGTAAAQRPPSKVVDTDALVIKPVDTTTTVVGRTFQYVSRVTASTLDNNALIRTVNNLFGTKPKAAPTQAGLSPLPDPSTYPSTYYHSPIQPQMPKYQVIQRK